MVTGQGEGCELPGYVVQSEKQIIWGGVRSGRKQTGFHFCSELPGSCLQTALCFAPSAWLHRRSTQLLGGTLSCFWGSVLMPEPQLRGFLLSEIRKAYCVMEQMRGNYANQNNPYLGQLRNINILLSLILHLFHSHLLLWLGDTTFAESTRHSQGTLLQKWCNRLKGL